MSELRIDESCNEENLCKTSVRVTLFVVVLFRCGLGKSEGYHSMPRLG